MRKQSRPNRARGKAGYRRFEALLEAANVVVQRVETENDIGRDAFIDIVDGTEVTGGVVCVQVKSGRSFFDKGLWVLPGDPADFTLWRESSIPFFGIVHDPDTDAVRWVDLSHAAMLAADKVASSVINGPYGKASVPVPLENRLDVDVAGFLTAAQTALRRRSSSPAALLIARDVETVEVGIVDTFALARHDPTAFLLLGALVHRLPKQCRRMAVQALAMSTRHPDVLWTQHNWIPQVVKTAMEQQCTWMTVDVVALLDEIDEEGIERGTIGQSVFHVLCLDDDINSKLFTVAVNRALADSTRFWAAAILLYLASEDAPEMLEQLVVSDRNHSTEQALFSLTRPLADVDNFSHLVQIVADFGYVSLF